ncbi:unnamed protein product, partial [Cylicostephanus goldi]
MTPFIRDSLCDLGRMEIPRPQFQGMQFVATRGKFGFYKTIRENGGKYGIQVKPQGPRRPALSNEEISTLVEPSNTGNAKISKVDLPKNANRTLYELYINFF